ncbi:hypothetical protein ACWDQO_26545 [Streptomyces sp. NPDC003703]|uniref:hypothetical protein n=1 Tax=Streptomyces sp. NPDC003283 TaxID=3364681 RepID=UPI0036A312E7
MLGEDAGCITGQTLGVDGGGSIAGRRPARRTAAGGRGRHGRVPQAAEREPAGRRRSAGLVSAGGAQTPSGG